MTFYAVTRLHGGWWMTEHEAKPKQGRPEMQPVEFPGYVNAAKQ